MQKTIHIFDLDGTLTDSMPFWAKGVYSLFENRQKTFEKPLDDFLILCYYIGVPDEGQRGEKNYG